MSVVATITRDAVKGIKIRRVEGPPRAYLSQRTDLLVLLRGRDGKIISRTAVPDPLQVRVYEPIPTQKKDAAQKKAAAAVHEYVTRVQSTDLALFLPLLEGASTIEFREKSETGRLLGSANIPDLK